ncbi:TIGR00730 family Rossman fold protein [Aquamicrobium segne]|uniref:Cytokinin riboside 5'-monophosphate phosphoribohydrolase n=1 Tax=Aquamicrobium segne TaxID=469547 RepID=A0ABW0GWW1_9HYPH
MNTIRSVCVYCGSSPGQNPAYMEAGRIVGRALAHSNLRLVYGGGTKGIMGAVSDATLRAGGKVLGIIPRFLMNKEASTSSLERLDEVVVTENMHQRKQRMFEESDAFVVLPGGIGTLEEIVEMMTWAQLGHHRKPMIFASINGFWGPMMALLDHMRAQGFIHTAHQVQPLVVNEAEAIIPAVLSAASATATPSQGVAAIIEKM